MEPNQNPAEKKDDKDAKGGLFTGKLTWWQIVIGLAVVGYLLYGKIQESNEKAAGTSQSAPAQSK